MAEVDFVESEPHRPQSPGSDISPSQPDPRSHSTKPAEYFDPKLGIPPPNDKVIFVDTLKSSANTRRGSNASDASTVVSPPVDVDQQNQTGLPTTPTGEIDEAHDASRKSSIASVTFRSPANKALPQGRPKGSRPRSPAPVR